ncbi:hypothetical protein GA0070215_12566 [Micromonospora marina]|uniref:Uncharacterized protein n=1 Tax=Micromonospora marina TaxID=307120 RepID=A0A1C5A8J6_9ACTN|nr:hypothetical protein GA0070215_12566 [Micromonospora marina]
MPGDTTPPCAPPSTARTMIASSPTTRLGVWNYHLGNVVPRHRDQATYGVDLRSTSTISSRS